MVNEEIKIEGIVERYKISYKKGGKIISEFVTAEQLNNKYGVNPLRIIAQTYDDNDTFYLSYSLPEIKGTIDSLIRYSEDECSKILVNGAFDKQGLIELRNHLANKPAKTKCLEDKFKKGGYEILSEKDIKKYNGYWVTKTRLVGGKVISYGSDPKKVVEEAKSKGYNDPIIFYVPLLKEN